MKCNPVKRRGRKTIIFVIECGLSVCTIDSKYKNRWLMKSIIFIYQIITTIMKIKIIYSILPKKQNILKQICDEP